MGHDPSAPQPFARLTPVGCLPTSASPASLSSGQGVGRLAYMVVFVKNISPILNGGTSSLRAKRSNPAAPRLDCFAALAKTEGISIASFCLRWIIMGPCCIARAPNWVTRYRCLSAVSAPLREPTPSNFAQRAPRKGDRGEEGASIFWRRNADWVSCD